MSNNSEGIKLHFFFPFQDQYKHDLKSFDPNHDPNPNQLDNHKEQHQADNGI